MTKTKQFGTGKRESHNSSDFYDLAMYAGLRSKAKAEEVLMPTPDGWADRIYQASSTDMQHIPDNSIALAFTSPPYNCGREYDLNMSMKEYKELVSNVGAEVYRVLRPGGRYVINIANLGRSPYIPMTAYYYNIHMNLDFLPMGEIIWQKAKGSGGSCAWGSWNSPKSPRLRDIHEYLLVFAKGSFSRVEKGESDLTGKEFMESTLSVWNIPPASAKRIGHPAPFPMALAERVIKLYSYKDDVVLDPFAGSGTTCVAAKKLGRHYVGYEIDQTYCDLIDKRLGEQ